MSFLISHTTLLCCLIRSAYKCGWGHLRSTCGYVSTSLVLHKEQVMLGVL
jgi:hypothetical protein